MSTHYWIYRMQVDGENAAIKRLHDLASNNKITTGKTTIGEEKEWNVFMRLSSAPVRYVIPALATQWANLLYETLSNRTWIPGTRRKQRTT